MNFWQGLLISVLAFAVATAAAADVSRLTLKVEGMTQTGCSSPPAIRGTTMNFPGVRDANVSLERGEMTVEYEPGQLELEKLIATVERACQVRITRPPAR
jgi:copper chaperone CopZ